jgi:hypothetical protein
MIFGILDLPSNTVNARVCKQWSDIALDILWREIDDLYFLFQILSPLKEMDEDEEGYVRHSMFYRVS